MYSTWHTAAIKSQVCLWCQIVTVICKYNLNRVLLTKVAAVTLTFNKQGLPERTNRNMTLIECPQKVWINRKFL